jgi:Na+/proline symporter
MQHTTSGMLTHSLQVTFVMMGLTWIQNRYSRFDTKTSEEFNTASRSVKPGLIAAGIVSAWTWAATLLQSATVGYRYGVAGPFWYAAGATVQILMFAILACKTKMNAPRCHTYLEIIYARYGKTAHIVFLFFALVTNILVGSQLLLGGSAVVTALTGMNVYAAVFLIPTGVCAYVILGGLRATFLCDYSHGLVLMIIIMYFMFTVYTSNETIGSPSRMYDLLQEAAIKRPVAGNHEGSYLTLKSNLALIFGVIQLCSGSGTVFLDQAYFQRAVASRPTTAVKAYIMGGLGKQAEKCKFKTNNQTGMADRMDSVVGNTFQLCHYARPRCSGPRRPPPIPNLPEPPLRKRNFRRPRLSPLSQRSLRNPRRGSPAPLSLPRRNLLRQR